MKALSIQQPWAQLIVQGDKIIENRSWWTNYRGPLLIHAGRRWSTFRCDHAIDDKDELPLGGIVGMVTLADVLTHKEAKKTKAYKKWVEGDGFCFVLTEARTLKFRPCLGKLGIFDVS